MGSRNKFQVNIVYDIYTPEGGEKSIEGKKKKKKDFKSKEILF